MNGFRTLRLALSALILLVIPLAATLSGCAFKIIRPEVMTVRRAPDGKPEEMRYPLRIIVHDKESFWDAHQIKSNLIGLSDLSAVHTLDLVIDAVTPGPDKRPLENSIEWIKNQYAKLPRWAPVNIVGRLFWAMGLEKSSYGRRAVFIPRIVYLIDWVRFTVGELNRVAGHAVPWNGGLIPKRWTAASDRGMDWAENSVIASYIRIAQGIDWGLDKSLDGGEWCWQKTVWAFAVPFVRPPKSEPSKP